MRKIRVGTEMLKSICVIMILAMGLLLQTNVWAKTDFVTKTVDNKKVLVKYNGNESKVTIPEGIKVIGGSAFEGNKKIKKVILSGSVVEIGDYAFNDCTNLKTVKFSDNLKKIYKGAFRNCKNIKTIKINKNLKLLDEFVFAGCTKLNKVTVAKENRYFKTSKGVLYSKNMKKLYLYPSALKTTTKFTAPKTVKSVYGCAFSRNKYLKTIVIQSKISCGESAFSKCKKLEKVEFKKPYMGGVDFSNCKKLDTVVLAEGTEMIGESQFEGCKSLVNINFPSSLKTIDMYAFSGCVKLTKPMFPNTVQVDQKAFD